MAINKANDARTPYPSLDQINTRVWLRELSRKLSRPATLDDIPDADLDHLAEMGFDSVWFLSVWQSGLAGRRVSRSNNEAVSHIIIGDRRAMKVHAMAF